MTHPTYLCVVCDLPVDPDDRHELHDDDCDLLGRCRCWCWAVAHPDCCPDCHPETADT